MPAGAIIPVLEYPDVPAAVKWLRKPLALMFDCESASTARSFNLLAAQLWFPKAIREAPHPAPDIR
jgi:hypothetical protein